MCARNSLLAENRHDDSRQNSRGQTLSAAVPLELAQEGGKDSETLVDQPQSVLFVSRFGILCHGTGLPARLAKVLRKAGIRDWERGALLIAGF